MDGIRVLYIDDDVRQRSEFAQLLTDRGANVTGADNGVSGLDLLESESFDVVMCDLNMPGMDGLEFLKRARAIAPDTPYLILTAHGSIEAAVETIRHGAYHFILKPLNIDDIEITIHQAIENSHLQRQLTEYSEQLEALVEERTNRLIYTNSQLLALNKLSARLSTIACEEMLFDHVATFLTDTLDFDRGTFLLYNGARFMIRSISFPKDSPELLERFRMRVESDDLDWPPHFEESYSENRTVVVRDLQDDPRWPKRDGQVIRTKAIVISPIRDGNTVVGLIVGNNQHHDRELDSQDIARFETFANMVGLQISAIRAYQGLEHKVEERTRSLQEANTALDEKARLLEHAAHELRKANINLMTTQHELERRNEEMQKLLADLTRKNDEFQAMLDSSTSAIVMVGNDGIISAGNRQLNDFFGIIAADYIDRRYHDLLAAVVDKFARPDEFRSLVAQLERRADPLDAEFFEQEQFRERVLELTAPENRLVAVFSLPVTNADGVEYGRLWIYPDITASVKSQEQLRLIVEASPVPTIISRLADGLVIYANAHLSRLVGYNREELVGMRTLSFYNDPSVRGQVLEFLRRDGKVDSFELQLKARTGKAIWVTMSLVVTELGSDKVVIGALTDITSRKRMEEELDRERNFVTTVLDTAGALVVILDPDGRIVRFNRACERLSGYAADEVIGKKFQELFFKPQDQDAISKQFEHVLKTGKPVETDEFWYDRSGTRHSVTWTTTVLHDENNTVEYIVGIGIDMTDRKRAEERLKIYRELFLNSKDSMVIFDTDGKYIESNPTHQRLSGYSQNELLDTGIQQLIDDETVKRIWSSLEKNGFYRGEILVRNREGSVRTMDLSAFPIVNDQDILVRYCSIGRDVTLQRKAQEALTVRARYEEHLAACSQALLTEPDEKTAIENALKALMGGPEASRVYLFENFQHPEDGLSIRLKYEVTDGRSHPLTQLPDFRDHFAYADGLERWQELLFEGKAVGGVVKTFPRREQDILSRFQIISVLALPITVDGRWYGLLSFDDCCHERELNDQDIQMLRTAAEMIGTYIERRQVVEALRVSEARFRTLVENATDVIYSMSGDGRFTYLSPQFETITGYQTADWIGRPLADLMPPEDAALQRQWVEQGMPCDCDEEGNVISNNYQFRMKTASGEYRWIISNASTILDQSGSIIEAIGIAHDITELKKVLEDLERTNRELRQTQGQLVQQGKMASLGQLVAGIAHEINTPIGAASSMHNTLMRAIDKVKKVLSDNTEGLLETDADLKKAMEIIDNANKVIQNGNDRVKTIVRRLRSFARLDEAELKTVDIHEGLEDTLTLIHHEIKHHIKVNRNFGKVPPIACYPGRLNQVFLNLLNNARQAIEGDGEITISTGLELDRVIIRISDSGKGISPEHLKRIFDPGFTTKGVGVGTGLGLSICFQIIQDHQGTITAESEVGKGSTFTIELPTDLDTRLNHRNAENHRQ